MRLRVPWWFQFQEEQEEEGELRRGDALRRRSVQPDGVRVQEPSIEVEFGEGDAVAELVRALADISKEVVQPIDSSVQDGKRKIRISFR